MQFIFYIYTHLKKYLIDHMLNDNPMKQWQPSTQHTISSSSSSSTDPSKSQRTFMIWNNFINDLSYLVEETPSKHIEMNGLTSINGYFSTVGNKYI